MSQTNYCCYGARKLLKVLIMTIVSYYHAGMIDWPLMSNSVNSSKFRWHLDHISVHWTIRPIYFGSTSTMRLNCWFKYLSSLHREKLIRVQNWLVGAIEASRIFLQSACWSNYMFCKSPYWIFFEAFMVLKCLCAESSMDYCNFVLFGTRSNSL